MLRRIELLHSKCLWLKLVLRDRIWDFDQSGARLISFVKISLAVGIIVAFIILSTLFIITCFKTYFLPIVISFSLGMVLINPAPVICARAFCAFTITCPMTTFGTCSRSQILFDARTWFDISLFIILPAVPVIIPLAGEQTTEWICHVLFAMWKILADIRTPLIRVTFNDL